MTDKPTVEKRKRGRPPKSDKSVHSRAIGNNLWEKAFLAQLRLTGVVTTACNVAKIGRVTVYEHRQNDPEFARAWDEAREMAADRLEQEAIRRAVDGTNKPVFFQGEIVGFEKEYSDTLLVLLLKAHKPDKYRERSDVRINLAQLSDEELRLLAEGKVP